MLVNAIKFLIFVLFCGVLFVPSVAQAAKVEDLSPSTQITVNDWLEESFDIGDVEVITGSLGTTWKWPVEISAEGSFIVSVDNLSCNGLAETYGGSFRTEVEGPTSFDFTNYVKSGFLSGNSDPNSGITIMRDGIVLLFMRGPAPMCEAPKPSIEVLTTSPYTRGGSVVVSVSMPENASSLDISTDFGFFPDSDRLPSGCFFGRDYRHIECSQSGGSFILDLIESFNPGQDTFKVRATAQFLDYDVTYGNGHPLSEYEVDFPLQPKYQPACTLTSQKIDVATYRFDFTWEDSNGDGPSIYAGSAYAKPTHAEFEGLSGSGSFTTTYRFAPGEVFTATLYVAGDPGVNCEEVVVLQQEMPDPECTISIRENEAFNSREFQVTWKYAYWDNPTLDFGDGETHRLGSPEDLQTKGVSEWIVHDFTWDTATGRSLYNAKVIVPVGSTEVVCDEEQIEIVVPGWMPEIVFEEHVFVALVTK